MNSIRWISLALLSTIQKIIPIKLILNLSNYKILIISRLLSVAIGALYQFNIRKSKIILAYSSISHIGWILVVSNINNKIPLIYLILYSVIRVVIVKFLIEKNILNLNSNSKFNFNKYKIIIIFLSIAGLPPLLGFLPKWIILRELTSVKNITIVITLLVASSLNFYIYTRLLYNPFLNKNDFKLNYEIKKNSFIEEGTNLILPISLIQVSK